MSGLLLRPWAESDAVELREAIDEDVSHLRPWMSWTLEEPATLAQTRRRLRRWVDDFRTGRGFRYAIFPSERPGRVLGGAHLGNRLGPHAHDVGYWVRKSAARRGIASSAVARIVVHAFEERDAERLVIQADPDNERSASLARALGFEPIGGATLRYPDGTPRRVLQFELTRERFLDALAPAFRARARRVEMAAG